VLRAKGPGSAGASIELSFGIEEASMLQKIDTVIVGGGQAGLAISYYLTQEGREHVVLERSP
jgi:ribulose 1,5-bisphosphate synthetase/thiazole synthase